MKPRPWIAFALLFLVSACTQPGPAPSGGGSANAQAEPRAARTLRIAMRAEPQSLSSRPLAQIGGKVKVAGRLFIAGLDINDDHGDAHPYLAEALPELNKESWQVFPDGTMETHYLLKPGLVWHDGSPLTADDFVFAWQVYTTPQITA